MKYTSKALNEQASYKLNDDPRYQQAIAKEYENCERRFQRYGYWVNRDIPTRNMIKALRMLPWQNTVEDWARLHVTEAAMKMK